MLVQSSFSLKAQDQSIQKMKLKISSQVHVQLLIEDFGGKSTFYLLKGFSPCFLAQIDVLSSGILFHGLLFAFQSTKSSSGISSQ